MHDRYEQTFSRLQQNKRMGFCPFAVLGDPTEKECLARIKKYLQAKPDFLELGIPFSDAIADGPIIQAANEIAIKNGMTPKKAIKLVRKIRFLSLRRYPTYIGATKQPSVDSYAYSKHDIPIGILTYSNIVLRYGIERFYRDLKKAGADSMLIADVPLEEIWPFASAAKKYRLHQIFLVSEYTDPERLKKIEKITSGFLYVVSALGVTGVRKKMPIPLFRLIRRLKTKTALPLMVGFGISKREHLKTLSKANADGYIVGSALVETSLKKITKKLNELKP